MNNIIRAQPTSRRRAVIKFIFISLATCIVVDILFFVFAPMTFFNIREYSNSPEYTSAVAILFHGFDKAGTAIDRETKRRLNYAISLRNNNQTSLLIMSGGKSSYTERTGAQLMADYAKLHRISEDHIFIVPCR